MELKPECSSIWFCYFSFSVALSKSLVSSLCDGADSQCGLNKKHLWSVWSLNMSLSPEPQLCSGLGKDTGVASCLSGYWGLPKATAGASHWEVSQAWLGLRWEEDQG